MDIAGLSMALSTTRVSNDISTAVLNMSLDNYQDLGENMADMLEKSVTPHLGQNIDIRV
ncbi:MAG: putative motility protein [Lachnospiraceae bacterium]|jgi:hypothetical protein|nr:putative motility protein [Lachnospiraceae bacterium]